jgi:hypothetical protein
MIGDFGTSKQLSETASHSNSTADGIGMIEYMEPQRFKFIDYKKTKKSDIYSLGVLLWEISSGRPPFPDYQRVQLASLIYFGHLREHPIAGTPLEYQRLYEKCWNDNPDLRPNIEEVYGILIELKTDEAPDIIVLQSPDDNDNSKQSMFLSIPDDQSMLISIDIEEESKNLLIVGYASSGKSTLSNVLCATNILEESEYSTSNTRNFQKNVFKWNGMTYRVVDIEFSSFKEILRNKKELIQLMPGGISQFLFVVDGRFKGKEIETLELIEKTIFDSGIVDYTTIVRTKFCNFKNIYKCKEDINQMCTESKTIAKIVKSCSVIHVDNPPINIIVNDDDDRERIDQNIKIREKSRTTLLSHLETVCRNKYYGYDNVFTCMFFVYLLLFI